MNDFKNVFRFLRNQKGYSQSELARELGISKSAISMYEVGKREPDFETLEMIADYFNVDMNFLLGKSGSEIENVLYQESEKKLLSFFSELNNVGKTKVISYAEDLSINPQYKKSNKILSSSGIPELFAASAEDRSSEKIALMESEFDDFDDI